MDGLLEIPRFLNRVEQQRVMDERGVDRATAARFIFDEDNGTPMPRIRTRSKK